MTTQHAWGQSGARAPMAKASVQVTVVGWGAALLIGIALLLLLQGVLQRAVEQAGLRRAIVASQTIQARHCNRLMGRRVQESCLLALNEEAALLSAKTEPTESTEPSAQLEPLAQRQTPTLRSSP